MKLTLKLVLLVVLIASLAAFCGGWRWGKPAPTHTAAAAVVAVADGADGWAWD
jgi:hypothetical protein